jgi:hypothetical protein
MAVVDPHRLLPDEAQQGRCVGLAQDLGSLDLVVTAVVDLPDSAHATLGDRHEQLVAACEHLSHK